MSLKSFILPCAAALTLALAPGLAAAQVRVEDPYARSASAIAPTGAAFMILINEADTDDRLVSAASDIAERVELHTHIADGDVMRMVEVEDGIPVPANGQTVLQRGGLHVMFLGLRQPLEQGDEVEVTLTFEQAGDMTVTIPVDLERMPERMGTMGGEGHGNMGEGHMGDGGGMQGQMDSDG